MGEGTASRPKRRFECAQRLRALSAFPERVPRVRACACVPEQLRARGGSVGLECVPMSLWPQEIQKRWLGDCNW